MLQVPFHFISIFFFFLFSVYYGNEEDDDKMNKKKRNVGSLHSYVCMIT